MAVTASRRPAQRCCCRDCGRKISDRLFVCLLPWQWSTQLTQSGKTASRVMLRSEVRPRRSFGLRVLILRELEIIVRCNTMERDSEKNRLGRTS